MLKVNFMLCLVCIVTFLSGCSSTVQVSSKWVGQPIIIDGQDDDWKDKTFYVKDKNLLIGIQNDNEYLYLVVISADRQLQSQIMRRGFVIWFDREGGSDKKFGIKFPLGFMESGMLSMRPGNEENPEDIEQMFRKEQSELEILIPGNDETSIMSISEAKGISAKIGRSNEKMVYEMKVALQATGKNLYGIGAQDNSKIGVGFEIAEIDREKMKEMIGSARGNFDREKIREGMENRRGDRKPGGMRELMGDQLKYWIDVQLVSK